MLDQPQVKQRMHCTPRAARMRVLGALLLCWLINAACYRYVPVQPSTVRPNEEVRVRITDPAVSRLVKDFGAYTGQLDGQLAPEGQDSLAISVMIARQYQGVTLENVRQTLVLARSEVIEVRRRQLSRSRTALATVGVLAAFGVLVNSVVQQGDPNPSDDNTPPPPPGIRGALIQFRIR